MKIKLENLNRRTIKKLPKRNWMGESIYDCLYLIPSGLKHESGWMHIAIVGQKEDGNMEVAAMPDDIRWDFTELHQKYSVTGMAMDCSYPNGVIHCHGRVRYIVGDALSSTDIKVIQV